MTDLTNKGLAEFLADLIGDVLSADVDPTRLDAKLIEDYDANSMDMVDIVERVERKLNVKVANDQVMELKTFGDVVQVVLSQKNQEGWKP